MFIKKTNDENVFFVRMNRGQTFYWHYVSVSKTKLPLLEKLSNEKEIDIKDYGNILESGWGLYPPKTIADKYPEINV